VGGDEVGGVGVEVWEWRCVGWGWKQMRDVMESNHVGDGDD
jgi:hypothetical protein